MIKSNIKEINNFINKIPSQLKYSSSVALNKTTDTALLAVQDELKASFDITTTWYRVGNKFGGRAKKSTKENLVSIMAITRGGSVNAFTGNVSALGGMEHWIQDHEGGDVRKPINSDYIYIPTKALKEAVGTTKGRQGRARIKKFFGKSTTFVREIRGNKYLMARGNKKVDGKTYGTTRTGRKSKRLKKVYQRNVIPIFLMKPSVKIKDDFDFFTPIQSAFNRDFQKNFDNAFENAIRTMK